MNVLVLVIAGMNLVSKTCSSFRTWTQIHITRWGSKQMHYTLWSWKKWRSVVDCDSG